MRDKNRIDPFLNAFKEYWLKHPDCRFGQIVVNLTRFNLRQNEDDLFFIEDEDFMEILNGKKISTSDIKTNFNVKDVVGLKEIEYGDKVMDENNNYGIFVGTEIYNGNLMGLIYLEVSKFAIRTPFNTIKKM